MSDKLRTLKDIECDSDDSDGECYNCHKEKLKQEAIKWIKSLNSLKAKKSYTSQDLGAKEIFIYHNYGELVPHNDVTAIVGFIKHFFNITEEDLK